MADPTDDDDRPTLRREWKGDASAAEHTGPLFAPDEVEATRLRQQGVGFGAEELRLQRDPTGGTTGGVDLRGPGGQSAVEGSEAVERVDPNGPRADPRH